MPLLLRLVVLFVVGTLLASLLNLAIYRLAWHQRTISPWSRGEAPCRWFHRIPIFGWIARRHQTAIYGRGFWVRPMLIELMMGAGWVGLYCWEVIQESLHVGQLEFAMIPPALAGAVVLPAGILHTEFFAHLAIIAFMVVAAFIDMDERLIPDTITIPGTLLGLTLAASIPFSLLPQIDPLIRAEPWAIPLLPGPPPIYLRFQTFVAPNVWPPNMAGAPNFISLALGVGCYWLWCFAILPRPWYGRHGWKRAWAVLTARFCRSLCTWPPILLITAGTLAIAGVWGYGRAPWAGLLSALVGLAGSGGLIWAVRIIGTAVLKKEAMGFGDVTLMMMIGTFVGWQASLIIFFIAPFALLNGLDPSSS